MRNAPAAATLLAASAAYSLISACGWGRAPTLPSPAPGTVATVTISASGLSEASIELPPGGRVTIVNGDDVAHDVRSDPHPTHDGCPELNRIGLLQPGQARTSGAFGLPGACGAHDERRPTATSLHLNVTIR